MSEIERISFDNNFLTMRNQNLEEAEELEDRRRHEKEIHNLLTHAMGDFNYDDHNASEEDNTSNALPAQAQTALEEKYCETNANGQLRVLYEVRAREVMKLNDQVEKVTSELAKQEKLSKANVTLLEMENEQKSMSLKEAQNLLVDKVKQIQQLDGQLENVKLTIKNLEAQITELNDEKFVLQQLNMDLEQQVAITKKKFPLRSTPSDKKLQESLTNKITQLESSLTSALEQIKQKDKQHEELVKELTQSLQEKDNGIVEQNTLINKLTENFDRTQRHCQELQNIIDELKEKAGNSRTESLLQEEIQKICEYNERTDILCDYIQKAVSTEFQQQISVLNSENKVLNEAIEQEQQCLFEMINQVNKEKEILTKKLMQCQKERDSLEQKHDKLTTDCENQFKLEKSKLTQELNYCEKDRDSWKHKCEKLTKDHDLLIATKKDNERLKTKISHLESYIKKIINPSVIERSVQVISATSDNGAEPTKLQDELISAHNNAAQFEKIIFEKCEKSFSVATNTDYFNDNEDKLLQQLKYDTILFQRETKISKEIKHEFDQKLKKIVHEYNKEKLEAQVCKECDNLKKEVKNLTESRERDRKAVFNIISLWEQKFADLEKESGEKITEVIKTAKAERDQYAATCLEKVEKTYEKRYKKLNKHLERLEQEIKREKELLLQANIHRYNLLSQKLERISSKLQ